MVESHVFRCATKPGPSTGKPSICPYSPTLAVYSSQLMPCAQVLAYRSLPSTYKSPVFKSQRICVKTHASKCCRSTRSGDGWRRLCPVTMRLQVSDIQE